MEVALISAYEDEPLSEACYGRPCVAGVNAQNSVTTDLIGRYALPFSGWKPAGAWTVQAVVLDGPMAGVTSDPVAIEIVPVPPAPDLEPDELLVTMLGYEAYNYEGEVDLWVHVVIYRGAEIPAGGLEGQVKVWNNVPCWPSTACTQATNIQRVPFEDGVATVGPFSYRANSESPVCDDYLEVTSTAWLDKDTDPLHVDRATDTPTVCA